MYEMNAETSKIEKQDLPEIDIALIEAKERLKSVRLRNIEISFNFLTGLTSAAYTLYLLCFTQLFVQVLGKERGTLVSLGVLALSLLLEAVMEPYTGQFSDRKGHHTSVRLSFVFLTVSILSYLFISHSFQVGANGSIWVALLVITECVLALGTAFQSGAINSWYVRLVREAGEAGPLTGFIARRRFWQAFAGIAVGACILFPGSVSDVTVPLTLAAVAYAAAMTISWVLIPACPIAPHQRESLLTAFRLALKDIASSKRLSMVFISTATLSPLTLFIGYYWQQAVISTEAGGVDRNSAFFALVWISLNVARLLGNGAATKIKSANEKDQRVKYYVKSQLLASIPLTIIPFVLLLSGTIFASMFLVVSFALTRFGQEIIKPILLAWIHEDIPHESRRASIESIIEGAGSLGFFALLMIVSVLSYIKKGSFESSDMAVVLWALAIIGFANLALCVPMMLREAKLRRKGYPSGLT
jgi:hypothetical protein